MNAQPAVEIDLTDDLAMSIWRLKRAKSVTLKIWRRGVLNHCCGRSTATGTRPVKSNSRRQRQCPQLEKLTMACLPTRQHLAQDHGRVIEKRQRLAEDHPVKTPVRIVGQPLLQVALAYAQPPPHAGQHTLFRKLDAPTLDMALAYEVL